MKKLMIAVTLLLFAMPMACLANTDGLGVTVVSKKCGSVEMSLRCSAVGGGDLDCLHPSLTLKDGDARPSKMATPIGMEKYSPVGLACSVSSKNGRNYFVVEYGELPSGCEYCEWFHIYDTRGKLLTSSNPPIQNVEGMEPPRDKAPNNSEFTALSRKLGLGKSEEEYLQCEGEPLDEKGNATCFGEP